MKKTIISMFFALVSFSSFAQVLIAKNTINTINLESSALLEIRDDKTGLLLPRVALIDNASGIITDNVTVPTPVDGVFVQSTTHNRFMFWLTNRWYKNLNTVDAENIIKVTTNYVAEESSGTTVTTFPASMPMFSIGSGTTGWTDLGVQEPITITKTNNTISIMTEGMAAINNTSNYTSFQFAIGVFIDNQLVLVRKFFEPSGGTCAWKQFNLSGIVENLSVASHTVKVMAYNLPRTTTRYTQITYGDVSSSSCDNLNTTMAKTVLSATVTQ